MGIAFGCSPSFASSGRRGGGVDGMEQIRVCYNRVTLKRARFFISIKEHDVTLKVF